MINVRSIRVSLPAWYAGQLALLLIIFSAATYAGLDRYLHSTLKESLTRRAKEIAPLLTNISGDGATEIIEIKSHYAPEADNGFLRISQPVGTVIYVSGPPRDLSFDPPRVPLPQPDYGMGANRLDRIEHLTGNGNLLISTFRVNSRDGRPLLMEIGASDKHTRSAITDQE